jgi:hypothetical protein
MLLRVFLNILLLILVMCGLVDFSYFNPTLKFKKLKNRIEI